MTTVAELMPSLLTLSDKEKAELVSLLLDSLPPPEYDVSDEEVMRRVAEAEANPSVLLTKVEFEAGLRDLLRR